MGLGWAPIPRDWRPYEKSWCGHAQGDRRPVQRWTPCAPWGEGSTCAGARDRGRRAASNRTPSTPRPAGSGTARQELAVVPAAGLYHLVAAAPEPRPLQLGSWKRENLCLAEGGISYDAAPCYDRTRIHSRVHTGVVIGCVTCHITV